MIGWFLLCYELEIFEIMLDPLMVKDHQFLKEKRESEGGAVSVLFLMVEDHQFWFIKRCVLVLY